MITHQADPPYPGLGHGTLAHLRGFLAEEEVELVIILLSAVWDEVCMDECGICRGVKKTGQVLLAFRYMLLYMLATSKCSDFSTFHTRKSVSAQGCLKTAIHQVCKGLQVDFLQTFKESASWGVDFNRPRLK